MKEETVLTLESLPECFQHLVDLTPIHDARAEVEAAKDRLIAARDEADADQATAESCRKPLGALLAKKLAGERITRVQILAALHAEPDAQGVAAFSAAYARELRTAGGGGGEAPGRGDETGRGTADG